MGSIKSNIKSHKKDMRKKAYNSQYRSSIKTSIKKVKHAASEGNTKELVLQVNHANKLLDRAAYKGIYHKNKVARHKQKLSLLLNDELKKANKSREAK